MYLSTATIETATATFTAPQLTRAVALYAFDSFKPPSKGDSQLQRWSSLIGIVTAIVGNILISFALNIQRYAHIRLHEERNQRKEKSKSLAKASQNGYGATSTNGEHRESRNGQDAVEEDPHLQSSFHSDDSQSTACSDNDHEHDSTYLKSPYWWGGIILMTIGEAGNFLAYGFAPASIVSPLGVVALISNCVIAPIMLKERFRLRDFWGVVVAVAGAVTVVLSAKQQEKKLGPHEILEAVTTTAFEVYMAVTICLIGALMWASPKYGSRTILIDLGLVGLFGGYTALSTKGVASMLSSTLWRALTTPITYVLVIILVGTAIMQVKYVNKALQRFDSTQVIPVQFVMFTLSVIMGSAILYRDFEKATAENVGKFIGGCLLTFFGVWLITSGRSRNDGDEEEESDEEGEQRISLANQDLAGNYSDGSPRNPSIQRKPVFFQNGDSANDEAIEDSRRSSRVSFVEPSPKVARAQSTSTSSNRGPFQVLTTAPSPEQEVPGTEETPLLRNPWKNTSEELLQAARHPGMSTTISSPVLPSEAQSSGESSKPPYARSSTQENPHTHPNHQQGPTPPNPDRPYTPVRHSISRMMPGPLLSPLSGGLSVVIADSLRRGVESPLKSRPFKRTRLGLRRTKSGSQKLLNTSSGSEEVLGSTLGSSREPPQEISKSLDQEGGNWSGITRARSLSNTLGELFRGKRQKTDRSDIADEDAGSSGS